MHLPRPLLPSALCALSALSALALAGCWPHPVQSNGAGNNLEFSMGYGPQTAGTNLPFHLRVERIPPQWSCTEAPNSLTREEDPSAVRPQGGNIPCAPSTPLPVKLVAAHCDADACVVTDDSIVAPLNEGSVDLRITPAHAGSITIHVTVRATDGSGSWDDSYSIPVADVDRLAWRHTPPDDAPASLAVPVGTPAEWNAIAVAADATVLAATDDAFQPQWQGDAFSVGPDGVAHAAHPGTATVTLTAAGKTKTETLRVFDPTEVRAIEARRSVDVSPSAASTGTPPFDVDTDVSQGALLSSIALSAAPDEAGPFALVLTLADGTRALGGANSLSISGLPVTVNGTPVKPEAYASYSWTFWISGYDDCGSAADGGSASAATLSAHVGQATLTLPLTLPVCAAPEAGAGD